MTKDVCKQRARQLLGFGAHVATRRHFTTWWIVEVCDADGRIMMTANRKTLKEAYSEIAVRLGGQLERRSA